MKKILLILSLVFTAVISSADVKMIGRDFWVDDVNLRPISFGVCSWTDEDVDCQLAGYLNISLLNFWDNHLRLGGGFAVTSPDIDNNISKVDMRLVTTVSTLFFDCLELGFYAAPFYNTYDGHVNDPWGFMIGYAFWF